MENNNVANRMDEERAILHSRFKNPSASTQERWFVPDNIFIKNLKGNRHYSDSLDKLSAPHKVDNLEKRFLVWTGKYKTLDEVPPFVSQSVMERTRNRMRIKIANYMMLATVCGCLLMVFLGKRDAKAGKSLTQENLDWHRKIKEEDEKKKAAAVQQ